MPKYLTLLTAFTNKSVGSKRPITVTILSILTFAAVVPPFAEQFTRNPGEVAFVYPTRLAMGTYFDFHALISATQVILFVIGIMTGIAILKKQRWAWFLGLGLSALAVVVYGLALWLLPPYTTNARLASMAIGLASLYLLSRTDVTTYLMPLTKT